MTHEARIVSSICLRYTHEMRSELNQFLEAYEQASNTCNFDNVAPLIADNALYRFTNGAFRGKTAIRKAFEETWANMQNETYTITDIEWIGISDDLACVSTISSQTAW